MVFNGKSADNLAELDSDRKSAEFFARDLQNGFAYCKIVVDKNGKPVDYIYLYVNDAYVEITRSKREIVLGKRATELFPTLVNDPVDWINKYGKVAITGQPARFEARLHFRKVLYSLFVYSPKKGYFAVMFDDVTDRKKAEEALVKSQDELQTIIDSSAGWIYYKDCGNRFIRVNKALAEVLGVPKKELENRSLFELYPKEDAEAYWDEDKQVITSGKPKLGMIEQMHSSKGLRWVQTDKIPFRDSQGNIIGVIGFSEDITERKKAEEATKESEEKFRNLAEESPNMIFINQSGRIVYANKKSEDILGYKREEFYSPTFSFLTLNAPEYTETSKLALSKHESGKEVPPYEFAVITREGKRIDAIIATKLIDYQGGKAILGIVTDITERKKTEKALKEHEKNLETLVEERTKKLELSSLYARNLIEASLDPLVTISVEGKITDVNKATELATGCSRKELIGSEFSDYFVEPKKAMIGYKRVFAEGVVRDYPLAIKNKNGRIVNVLYNATVYRNNAGEIQGVFAAARDITEQKKAEAEAQEAAKKLKDSERLAAIGATAGMVGHDIRNPLQAITSDVFLAKTELTSIPDSVEKKNVLESMDEIEKNIDYINKIVQDLQDYARPLNPNAGEADLKLIIDKLLEKNILPKNVKAVVRVEDEARKFDADADFLNRILYNLVTNAVQAMPKGGKLTTHVYKEANDVVITVKDTGVGIPKAIQSKMFTPMFTTKSKGQGFGLPVVKRMTESLGGTVTFESEEGKGTTFFVRLPIKKNKT